ncbi:MAG: acetyl-CoA carboxylase biotin carboxylase subunit [Candidatus Eremiobacteraeota bacterium]|nr:acetyl-CoA carboxylase biotin carboxylase subunit [Candidatus Eremiobacteraeota bacterium]
MIRRLLIANRGEIAIRVARTAHEMGIAALGIYSTADEHACHVRAMDEARCIGPALARDSYLNIEAVLGAAHAMDADAVHPGYGFLSERADFARAVLDAGLIFVGPSPEAMAAMGSKIEAKQKARAADVPVIPGYDGATQDLATLRARAEEIGFPLLIKASAGGGGRGMRVVDSIGDFDEALDAAKRESLAAFGDESVLLERYLRSPRHIEFQILGDSYGNIVHFGERECSIQRRHQKVVEEAPSTVVSPELRARMGEAALRAARSVGYSNAGTAEFMLDSDDSFYFLEMNARLQVEHPITEFVYGLDLVEWQIRVASGERLPFSQEQIQPRGAAIEVRICAEDPSMQMLPSTGTIDRWEVPHPWEARVDSGVALGSEVTLHYDSLLAKLIVAAPTRDEAVRRLQHALDRTHIGGLRTNLPLLRWIAQDEAFVRGDTTTSFLAERLDESRFARTAFPREVQILTLAAMLRDDALPWRIAGIAIPVALARGDARATLRIDRSPAGAMVRGDLTGPLRIIGNGATMHAAVGDIEARGRVRRGDCGYAILWEGIEYEVGLAPAPEVESAGGIGDERSGAIRAPMPGKILRVAVAPGDRVEARTLLVVLEAMKMEHRIEAPGGGTIAAVHAREGATVAGGATLVEIES